MMTSSPLGAISACEGLLKIIKVIYDNLPLVHGHNGRFRGRHKPPSCSQLTLMICDDTPCNSQSLSLSVPNMVPLCEQKLLKSTRAIG
jgi:hypothetical protein